MKATKGQFRITKKNCATEKNYRFDDVDKATDFWKELQEQKGTGNPFNEIANGDQKCHRQSTETEWLLDTYEATKVI